MKQLRTLKFFQKFNIKIKKSKTFNGCCLFQGLSNDTTLSLIQSGRTVSLSSEPQNTKMPLSSAGKKFISWRGTKHRG
jgi:hypothetical protein